MKKVIFMVVVLCLAVPAFATPSLGLWDEGDVGTTHQLWHFTPGYVTAISGDGYTAKPEEIFNPRPNDVVASISPGGTWDGVTEFISTSPITVMLEIQNYEYLNQYKEVWVDIGDASAIGISVTATDGGSITFDYMLLPRRGDAEFGIRISPNPYVEKINFTIWGTPDVPAVLDYIHVDTICVPEPATVGLLSFSVLTLLRKKVK
jgi:hypothetical protein